MSTAQALKNLERDMGDEFDRDMSKVVAMKKPEVSKYVAPDPEGDTEKLIEATRNAISVRRKRITQTKKGCKATLASLSASKKEAKARFEAQMADYAEREAEAKAQADKDVKADEAYIAMCEAALSAAPTE